LLGGKVTMDGRWRCTTTMWRFGTILVMARHQLLLWVPLFGLMPWERAMPAVQRYMLLAHHQAPMGLLWPTLVLLIH